MGRRSRILSLTAVLAMLALFGALSRPGPGEAPVVADLKDGRSGLFRFASRDAPAPATVTGELRLPSRGRPPFPAAVMLHGSDGLSDLQHRYAARLADRGIAALVLDSFGPRGVASTVGNQRAVSPEAMLADVYAALALLATHPGIDAGRIALVGWSKGGLVADWASRRRFRDRLAPDGARFAAHAAFYSWCGAQDFRPELTGAPLLFLLGALDDWSGSRACVDYAARLRDAGYDATAIVYPEAHHGFDYDGRFRRYLAEAVSYAGCSYFIHDTGFVDAESGRFERWPDLDRHLRGCTTRGAHVGTNAAARKQALADLEEFLTAALGRD